MEDGGPKMNFSKKKKTNKQTNIFLFGGEGYHPYQCYHLSNFLFSSQTCLWVLFQMWQFSNTSIKEAFMVLKHCLTLKKRHNVLLYQCTFINSETISFYGLKWFVSCFIWSLHFHKNCKILNVSPNMCSLNNLWKILSIFFALIWVFTTIV